MDQRYENENGDRMNIAALLEYLYTELETSSSWLLTGKRLVDAEKCMDIVSAIRKNLPIEIQDAMEVLRRQHQILDDAHAEANAIIKDSEQQAIAMVNDHEIMRRARQEAQIVLNDARREARDIRMSAVQYADELLVELEKNSSKIIDQVRRNRQELQGMFKK